MSYQIQYALVSDGDFQARTIACVTEQALSFRNDQRPSFVALAESILRAGQTGQEHANSFVRFGASGPGISDKVDNGDGTINSDNVTDGDLLSLTQTNWPTIAGLYFNEDGTPIGG